MSEPKSEQPAEQPTEQPAEQRVERTVSLRAQAPEEAPAEEAPTEGLPTEEKAEAAPGEVSAEVSLLTPQLEKVVSEWLARAAGITTPVKYQAEWGWSPGEGPTLVRMRVWDLGGHVAEFRPRKRDCR